MALPSEPNQDLTMVVLQSGVSWPGWPRSAAAKKGHVLVELQNNVESSEAFELRIAARLKEMSSKGLVPRELILVVHDRSEGNGWEAQCSLIRGVARALSGCTGLRQIVIMAPEKSSASLRRKLFGLVDTLIGASSHAQWDVALRFSDTHGQGIEQPAPSWGHGSGTRWRRAGSWVSSEPWAGRSLG